LKLKELTIPNHKGFIDFKTTFDMNTPITTVIGQNGVGKSNLIEIIICIYRAIDLGESTDFSYGLSYECRGHDIQIDFDIEDKSKTLVRIDGKKKTLQFLKNNSLEYLPLNIFTYYSGTNERVEQLFAKHQSRFYNALFTEDDDRLLRRFFYCRDVHSFFVLLAFLVDDDPACKALLEQLNIASLDSVLFCLKKPYWYKGKPSDVMLEEGDARFWYSRGVVQKFLDNLCKYAIAPIDNTERKVVDFRGRSEKQDRLYLFLSDDRALKGLASEYQDTTTLFKHIESTYIADLLEDVQVTIRLTDGKKLTFSALSEGERQLLTVLGLMKFTRNDESLFLLDEPDTHLNPRWKLSYFDQVKKILDHKIEGSDKGAWETSQIVLTTHDPIMLTSLHAEQIRVLTESKEFGKESKIPEEDPISMGIEAIIQSSLYGIRTSLDDSIQKMIDERNELLAKSSGIYFSEDGEVHHDKTQSLNDIDDVDEVEARIQVLNAELDNLGILSAHPNPYYSNFSKALARSEVFKKPHFSAEEYVKVQNLSDKLLARVIDKGDFND
jgi:predicted ATPase